MAISTHVVVTGVDETLPIALNVKHGRTEYMTRVVCCHFDFTIAELNSLVELNRADLVNAILDHFAIEAVYFTLLSD